MLKRLGVLAALVLPILGAGAAPAHALLGAADVAPAATLLIPYFEVDLDDANGVTTLFSISNTSATAVLAHVTVWSDQSIPVLDWDVYLTGYDIQSLNLRDVLVGGILPDTASAGQDPTDTISPKGILSQDINFASCAGLLPYAVPAVSANFKIHLQALLTGKKSPIDGTCAGQNHGDNIARGYVTIDTTNSCSLLFPNSTGYFVNGGSGIATNQNVLTGDYFYVEAGDNFAQGNPAVHIEAGVSLGIPGTYTFYGRYVAGSGADNREPLPTTWFARFLNGGGFDGGTDFIVWRDSKFPPAVSCTTGPNYGDLLARQIVVFDEEENPVTTTTGGPSGEPIDAPDCLFCDEAQRTSIAAFGQPFDFGMVYLNLNHATALDAVLGPGYIGIAQSWVVTTMDASGRFSVGFDATAMDNARTPANVVLPLLSPFL